LTREKDDEMTTTPSRLLFALLSSESHRPEALARITRALDEAGGNVRAAHEALGVPATTFSGWRRKWPELEDVITQVRKAHGYRHRGGFFKKSRSTS
jgi:transposase-like protein